MQRKGSMIQWYILKASRDIEIDKNEYLFIGWRIATLSIHINEISIEKSKINGYIKECKNNMREGREKRKEREREGDRDRDRNRDRDREVDSCQVGDEKNEIKTWVHRKGINFSFSLNFMSWHILCFWFDCTIRRMRWILKRSIRREHI